MCRQSGLANNYPSNKKQEVTDKRSFWKFVHPNMQKYPSVIWKAGVGSRGTTSSCGWILFFLGRPGYRPETENTVWAFNCDTLSSCCFSASLSSTFCAEETSCRLDLLVHTPSIRGWSDCSPPTLCQQPQRHRFNRCDLVALRAPSQQSWKTWTLWCSVSS